MTDVRTLVGWGARDWSDLVTACDDMVAAWSDYLGFHVGSLPDTQPPSSHVWAWSSDGGRLMRARADGHQMIVGWLLRASDPTIDERATSTKRVDVTVRPLRAWAPNDNRVTLRGSVRGDLAWRGVDVETADPVTFIWAIQHEAEGARKRPTDR